MADLKITKVQVHFDRPLDDFESTRLVERMESRGYTYEGEWEFLYGENWTITGAVATGDDARRTAAFLASQLEWI